MSTIQEKMLAVRRKHVLDAAVSVFAEKGFRGATIRDVSIAAGVSDGTIYNLFENKAALLHAILVGASPPDSMTGIGGCPVLADMLRGRWKAITPDSLAMLRVILSEALIDPEFRDLYRQTLLMPAIEQLVGALAANCGLADHLDRSSHDARLVTALFMGLVMLRLMGDDVVEKGGEPLLDRLGAFVEHGLPPFVTDSSS